jgi:2-polyprenyl-3-methyl-5-hydroxy-6-metoxy-1,4-benzoquinol methylase
MLVQREMERALSRFVSIPRYRPGIFKAWGSFDRMRRDPGLKTSFGVESIHIACGWPPAHLWSDYKDRYQGAIMNPNKALWEKGDFTQIAALLRQSGEALVKSLGITPPLRVLDLGCGDGTTAVPLALLGAEVVGIDIAKNLVDAGNKRAAEAGLHQLTF